MPPSMLFVLVFCIHFLLLLHLLFCLSLPVFSFCDHCHKLCTTVNLASCTQRYENHVPSVTQLCKTKSLHDCIYQACFGCRLKKNKKTKSDFTNKDEKEYIQPIQSYLKLYYTILLNTKPRFKNK